MPTARDVAFAQAAVAEGIIASDTIDACLAEMKRAEEIGGRVTIDVVLLRKGLITQLQADAIWEKLASSRIPKQLAGFELLEMIGRTPHCTTFKARQSSMDRFAALNVLSPRLAANQRYVERLFREARTYATISHTNILQTYEVGQASGFCYIASEYVEGETLADRLAAQGKLPQADALAITEQVCMALHCIDTDGSAIHGTIKPESIFLARSGLAKLAGLGLSNADAEAPEMQTDLPFYVSPEQARKGEVDIRSDIYSLGAVLFHMVTGTPPFIGATREAVISGHLKAMLPAAGILNAELAPEICGLLENMLAKDRNDRYCDPEDLLQEIQSVRMGLPLRKNRRKAKRQPVVAEPSGRSFSPQILVVVGLVAVVAVVAVVLLLGNRKVKPLIDTRANTTKPAAGTHVQPPAKQPVNEKLARAERAFEAAEEFRRKNPDAVSKSIENYLGVASNHSQTPWGRKAEDVAAELQVKHEGQVRVVFEKAKADADAFVEDERYARALEVYRQFPSGFRFGVWKAAIEAESQKLAAKAKARSQDVLDEADRLIGGRRFSQALRVLEKGERFEFSDLNTAIRPRRVECQAAVDKERRESGQLAEQVLPSLVKTVVRYERRGLFELASRECQLFSEDFAPSLVGENNRMNDQLQDLKTEILTAREVWKQVAAGLAKAVDGSEVKVGTVPLKGAVSNVTDTSFVVLAKRYKIFDIDPPNALEIGSIKGTDELSIARRIRFFMSTGLNDKAQQQAETLPGSGGTIWQKKIAERKLLVPVNLEVDKALVTLDDLQDRATKKQWKMVLIGMCRYRTAFPEAVQKETEREFSDLRLRTEAGIAETLKMQKLEEPGEFIDVLERLYQREKFIEAHKCPKYATCPDCNGKKRGCTTCKGAGMITRDMQTYMCPSCHGKPGGRCERCQGRGQVACPECNGRGFKGGDMSLEVDGAVTELSGRFKLNFTDVNVFIKE